MGSTIQDWAIMNKFLFIISLVFSVSTFAADTDREYQLLKDPYLALNARVRPLLGKDLTVEEFNAHDPQMDLDFSQAPELKTVILSTLVITHDFIGTIMLRLLDHHANKGTQIYVMVTKQLIYHKEKDWLARFSKSSPNIHFYIYNKEDASLWTKIQSANHVKVFLTIPKELDQGCSIVSGGRNTSDMYFFETKPLYPEYPELVQWGEKKYEWSYFDDLDILTKNCTKAQRIESDLIKFFNKTLKGPVVNDEFILSIPSSKNLEKSYVKLIDQASVSIKILSPYLNITESIFQALIRAQKRNVLVEMVTAKSIASDYLPIFLQPAMNYSLRKILKHFKVHLYSFKENIPHAKALLIDDKMLSIGSVNLNQRSFHFDTEFTQLISDAELINDFNEVFQDSYINHSEEVGSDYKIPYGPMETLILGFEKAF